MMWFFVFKTCGHVVRLFFKLSVTLRILLFMVSACICCLRSLKILKVVLKFGIEMLLET